MARGVWGSWGVTCLIASGLILGTDSSSAVAQQPTATLSVMAKPADVIQSQLGKALSLPQLVESAGNDMDLLGKISSVQILIDFPEKLEELQEAFAQQKVGFGFVARVQFEDAASLDQWREKIEGHAESFEKDGLTHYRAPTDEFSNWTAVFQPDGLLVLASDGHDLGLDQATPQSDELKKLQSKAGTIHLAFDLQSNRQMLKEALKLARKAAPQAMPVLVVPDQMEAMELMVDTDKEQMVTLVGKAADAEKAEELKTSFDGLVGLAKGVMDITPEESPADQWVKKLLGAVSVEKDGLTVKLTIRRWEGCDQDLAKMIQYSP